MPYKGLFTASAIVLFDRVVSREELEDALATFDILKCLEPATDWAFGGGGVRIGFESATDGAVLVDTVPHRWPDDMGDPKTERMIFAAWTMGHFGPAVYPGGLTRSSLQAWSWPEAREVPLRHRAFVRVRVTYSADAMPETPIVPTGYEPLDELGFITQICTVILTLPGAIGYFNPNGETLRSPELVLDAIEHAESANVPPLDLWVNVRLFNLDAGWKLMDTVGNTQFDDLQPRGAFPDLEACIPPGDRYDLQDIDGFLRDITLFLLTRNIPIRDGDTVPGPGGALWTAHERRNGLVTPPRRTLRFFPDDGTTPPEPLLTDSDEQAGSIATSET